MSAFLSAFRRELTFLESSFWDRAMITWIPLILTGILALQLSSGVMRDLPVVVVDQDQTQVSRELTAGLEAAPGLTVAARIPDITAAEQLIRSKKAYAIVLIPDGTGRAVQRGGTSPVTVLYNASYSTASGAALREINAVVQDHSAKLATQHTAALAAAEAYVRLRFPCRARSSSTRRAVMSCNWFPCCIPRSCILSSWSR